MTPFNMFVGGAVLGLLILTNTYSYFAGRESIQGEYHEFKTAVAAAQADLQADADQARLHAERTTQDVADAWASVLGSVRADYVSRLRGINSSCARPLPTTASATTGPDDTTADVGPDPASPEADFGQVCQRLEADCAQTTGQLIWLQHWVSEVSGGDQ